MSPAKSGTKTELIYCMYIDPGFPVPQWIIREGVKNELPKTLIALRQRVEKVCEHPAIKEKRTILAALMKFPYHHANSNFNGSQPNSEIPANNHADSLNTENIKIDKLHKQNCINGRTLSLAKK